MADWNLPTLSDLYQDFLNLLKGRDDDLAKMFDGTTSSNLPVGTIRWNDANARFEKWDGTAWSELTTKYLINVDTVDGIHASATPTANNLLPLDASGILQASISGDADTVDGMHASDFATSSHQHSPIDIYPYGPGSNLHADTVDGYHAVIGDGATEFNYSVIATTAYGEMKLFASSRTALYAESVTARGITAISDSSYGIYSYSNSSYGIYAKSLNSIGVFGTGQTYDFYAAGAGTNYGPFTGAHDGLIRNPAIEPGDIVVDVRLVRSSNISNAIFEVALSSQKAQKTAVGVCVFTSDLNERNIPAALLDQDAERDEDGQLPSVKGFEQIAAEYDLISFNALGEGHINVCGEGGDIEAGDYICTSSMTGKGMRQDDDLYHNYTVARARAPVTFDSPDEVKQVPCIYLCG